MTKNNKNKIWITLIIIGIIIFMQSQEKLKGAQADVSSAAIVRSFSAEQVKAGSTFTVNYAPSNYGSGTWGVLLTDIITNDCTVNGKTEINTGFTSTQVPSGITAIAPSYATICTFNGNYEFVTSTLKPIQGQSNVNVIVCNDECSIGSSGCTSSTAKWSCILGPDGICNIKSESACPSGFHCSAGICGPECMDLENNAVASIISWVLDPIATKRTTAINALTSWVTNC